jgi:hypothetical protein
MATRLKPLKQDAARLWKMITTNDREALRHGLAIAEGLGCPLDGVLDAVEVDGTGELIRSSRFSGTAFEQPVLDVILLHQLSMALPDSPEDALRARVRSVDLRLRTVPRLIGFSGLEFLSITLDGSGEVADLADFGDLPKLRTLTIETAGKEDSLHSLQGLQAPLLEQVILKNNGLQDIAALTICKNLISVDLSGNPMLETVDGLKESTATLRQIRLAACMALRSLKGLTGATQLELLELKDCMSLKSLAPLAQSNQLGRISLDGCANLESLQGLTAPCLIPIEGNEWWSGFSLSGCASLSSLKDLPELHESFRYLKIEGASALKDLTGIEAAKSQNSIQIDDAPIKDLNPLASLQNTTELHLSDLPMLEDGTVLGCLSGVKELYIYKCPKLRILPGLWQTPLVKLTLNECPAIQALGKLPPSLEELNISDCVGVTHLKGVESAKSLKLLECDTSLIDGSAVADLPLLEVQCFLRYPQAKNENVARAFGGVMPLRLHIGEVDNTAIRWITELPGLVSVRLTEDCAKANRLSKTDYAKETEVRTLQRQLCRAQGLPVPAYLKSTRSSLRSVEGGPAIIQMITSLDSATVSQALELLRASGDPKLFDQVFEGSDPATAYTGDSRAIGRIFREVRADDRLLARWALTSALADAPDSAVQAVAVRQRVSEIVLALHPASMNGWMQQPLTEKTAGLRGLPMPSLSRFTGLKCLKLEGLAVDDLSFLGEIPSLERLSLENLPTLSSLKGLIGTPHLKSIHIKNCPSLHDIQDLRYLGDLEGSGFSALDLYNLGPLSDLSFVAGLKSLAKIKFKAAPKANLLAFLDAESIAEVEIDLDNWDIDLSPLRHVRNLKCWSSTVYQENTGPVHQWAYKWPKLQQLAISFGVHNFEELQAGILDTVDFSGKAQSLKGLGPIRTLHSYLTEVQSIDSLVESQLSELDVSNFPGSFEAIKVIKTLRRLRLPRSLTSQRVEQLTACDTITNLDMNGFSGSLGFLAGWNALFALDLRDSGNLTGIEVLLTLPALQSVRLKGAQLKRDAWPKPLQDRMTYKD